MNAELMKKQVRAFAEADSWYVPLLSNAAALLWDGLEEINWAGFYILTGDHLTLGPFQGKPACIHIPVGKGVCGTAVKRDETLRVSDVHTFEGHIACDSASNSEIVIPIHDGERAVAVLDIDSPVLNRFSQEDQAALEEFVKVLEQVICWSDSRFEEAQAR